MSSAGKKNGGSDRPSDPQTSSDGAPFSVMIQPGHLEWPRSPQPGDGREVFTRQLTHRSAIKPIARSWPPTIGRLEILTLERFFSVPTKSSDEDDVVLLWSKCNQNEYKNQNPHLRSFVGAQEFGGDQLIFFFLMNAKTNLKLTKYFCEPSYS